MNNYIFTNYWAVDNDIIYNPEEGYITTVYKYVSGTWFSPETIIINQPWNKFLKLYKGQYHLVE